MNVREELYTGDGDPGVEPPARTTLHSLTHVKVETPSTVGAQQQDAGAKETLPLQTGTDLVPGLLAVSVCRLIPLLLPAILYL